MWVWFACYAFHKYGENEDFMIAQVVHEVPFICSDDMRKGKCFSAMGIFFSGQFEI